MNRFNSGIRIVVYHVVISILQMPEYEIAIEYGIFGEGSHISTNQKRENGAFSLLIG